MSALSATDTQGLVRLAQDLIRIPSLSGDEAAVAARLQTALQQSGCQDVWVDRAGNVIGRYGAGRGPKLILEGHMDTVGLGERSAWKHDPLGGEIDNGYLYGRGTIDMKAALAAMVYAVKGLAEAGTALNGDLYVAFVVQEEPCEGMAARVLIEEEGLLPDFVVLGEPTNLGLYRGQRGRVELQVTTYGRSSHAALPREGINAVLLAARLLFSVDLLGAQLLTDPLMGQGSLAVTHIESSATSLNSIPDRCAFVLDRRLTLGETEARAIAEVQQVIRREGVRADVSTIEFQLATYTGYVGRGRKYYPPWLLPEDSALSRRAGRALEKVLGATPRPGIWPFSTDGAYTMGIAGIPTIGFGPGDPERAHTADEAVRVHDLITAAQGYAQLAVEILK